MLLLYLFFQYEISLCLAYFRIGTVSSRQMFMVQQLIIYTTTYKHLVLTLEESCLLCHWTNNWRNWEMILQNTLVAHVFQVVHLLSDSSPRLLEKLKCVKKNNVEWLQLKKLKSFTTFDPTFMDWFIIITFIKVIDVGGLI